MSLVWHYKLILLYYLSHIPSILVLSHSWWSLYVFSVVYRRRTRFMVSSETTIQLVVIFFCLSVSPLSIRYLIRSAHYWTQHFRWIWGQGQWQPWGTSPPPNTLVPSLRYMSGSTGSWIQCPPPCLSQLYLTSRCCKNNSQWWVILYPPPLIVLETPLQFYLWTYNKLIGSFVSILYIPSTFSLVIFACFLPVILISFSSNSSVHVLKFEFLWLLLPHLIQWLKPCQKALLYWKSAF